MYAYLCIYIIRCIMFFRWIDASMIHCDILKCSSLLLPPLSHFPDHITCTLLFSLLLTTPPVSAKVPLIFFFLVFCSYCRLYEVQTNPSKFQCLSLMRDNFGIIRVFNRIQEDKTTSTLHSNIQYNRSQ